MAGKKQHYVPQFMLRNFALPGGSLVAAYRLREGKYLPRVSVRDSAHENNLYGHPVIEDSLAGLEGEAARIFRSLAAGGAPPTYGSSDQHALLTFLLAQLARTPGAVDETNAMADRLAKRVLRDVPELSGQLDLIEISVVDAPAQTLGTMLRYVEIIRDLAVKVLRNETDMPYVLGDEPAVLYNQFLEPRKRTGNNVGLSVKGLQVFLPVDTGHTLLFFDKAVYKVGGRRLDSYRVDVTAEKDVRALNLLQIANAEQAVFSNGGLTEFALAGLAGRAAKYRPDDKAMLDEYMPASGNIARDGSLLRCYRPDLRTRLSLSFVKLTPHAQQYDLGNRIIHRRDPMMHKLHVQFLQLVDRGKYGHEEYGRFLREFLEAHDRGSPYPWATA